MSLRATRSIYLANFHAPLRYGLYFWGGDTDSKGNILTHCLFQLHRQVDVSSFYSHLPAYEDGTDRVFQNVGI